MAITTTAAAAPQRRAQSPARLAQLGLAAAAITSSMAFTAPAVSQWSSTSITFQRSTPRVPFSDITSVYPMGLAGAPSAGAPAKSAMNPVVHLREMSDLTAAQIARLCDVSRRSVQNWIGGAPMAAVHEERLSRLTSVIRVLGDAPAERRQKLLSSVNGMSLFHQLIAELEGEAELDPAPASVRDKLRV